MDVRERRALLWCSCARLFASPPASPSSTDVAFNRGIDSKPAEPTFMVPSRHARGVGRLGISFVRNVCLLHECSFAPLLSLLVEVNLARRSTKGTSPLFSYQGCPEKSPLTFHNHVVSLSRSPPLVPGPNILAPLEVFFKGSHFSLLPFFHHNLLTPASVSHQTCFTVSF